MAPVLQVDPYRWCDIRIFALVNIIPQWPKGATRWGLDVLRYAQALRLFRCHIEKLST
jgi:hypothetical protein